MGAFFCNTHNTIHLFLTTATVLVVMVTFSWPESRCNGFCHPPKGVGGGGVIHGAMLEPLFMSILDKNPHFK